MQKEFITWSLLIFTVALIKKSLIKNSTNDIEFSHSITPSRIFKLWINIKLETNLSVLPKTNISRTNEKNQRIGKDGVGNNERSTPF